MDPAPIFVPKVHLKAVMMKHVLQTQRREQLNSFDLNYPALILGSKVRQEQRPMAPETHSSAPAQISQVNQTITAWSQRIVSDLILPYQKSTESSSFVLKKNKKNKNKQKQRASSSNKTALLMCAVFKSLMK